MLGQISQRMGKSITTCVEKFMQRSSALNNVQAARSTAVIWSRTAGSCIQTRDLDSTPQGRTGKEKEGEGLGVRVRKREKRTKRIKGIKGVTLQRAGRVTTDRFTDRDSDESEKEKEIEREYLVVLLRLSL